MSSKILPLPESVRSKLRSGVSISCVGQCVEELVLNSLDAGATCIAIIIDFSIFRIQVVDNGHGICHENLKILGSRHSTSKCHSLQDLSNNLTYYGFRGEALASIVDLAAIIDVTTRSRGSTDTYTKLFMYGKGKSVSPASKRPSVGTTITIQDFMYNMPVRRKLIKEALDIENICIRLKSFALMHPDVSFCLKNDNTNEQVFQASKSNGLMSTFIQLFGSERAQGLAEVFHSIDNFNVSGYVGTQPHTTKSLQFVYVNKRLVLKTKIHKFLNDLLTRSSIISSRLHPTTPAPGRTPSSPTKGLRLYGMFVLNIECPLSDYDICFDPRKTLVEFKEWDKLLLCIEEMILNFIRDEGLVISLDERYRRSGREKVEDDLPVPHSSQALLQVFSRKRTADTKVGDDLPKEKYGRTICVEDNLSGLRSLIVRRINTKMENQISCVDPEEDDFDDLTPVSNEDDNSNGDDNGNHNSSQCQYGESSGDNQNQQPQKMEECQGGINTKKTNDHETLNKAVQGNVSPVRNNQDLKNLSHAEYIKSVLAKKRKDSKILQEKNVKNCSDDELSNQGEVDEHSKLSNLSPVRNNQGHVEYIKSILEKERKDSRNIRERILEEHSDHEGSSQEEVDEHSKLSNLSPVRNNQGHVEYIKSILEKERKDSRNLRERILEHSDHEGPNQEVKEHSQLPNVDSIDEANVSDLQNEDDIPTFSSSLFEREEKNLDIQSVGAHTRNCPKATETNILKLSEGTIETDFLGENRSEKSSLRELKELYDEKVKEIYSSKTLSTPEQDLIKTPSSPPPLKNKLLDYANKLDSIDQSPSSSTLCTEGDDNEQRSLSSLLKDGMLKYQKKKESSKFLEKFKFKKSFENSGGKSHLEETKTTSLSRKCSHKMKDKTTVQNHEKNDRQVKYSLRSAAKSNLGSELIENNPQVDGDLFKVLDAEDPRNPQNHCDVQLSKDYEIGQGNDDTNLDSSFRFSPVLTSTFKNDSDIKTSECSDQFPDKLGIPQHSEYKQSFCTVPVIPEPPKDFTNQDIVQKKMVSFSQHPDCQVIKDQIIGITKTSSGECYEGSENSIPKEGRIVDFLVQPEAEDKSCNKFSGKPFSCYPGTQPFEIYKDGSSADCDPGSQTFIQETQSFSELKTPAISLKDLVQKNGTERDSAAKDTDIRVNSAIESKTYKGIHKGDANSKDNSDQIEEMTESSFVIKESTSVEFPISSDFHILSSISGSQQQQPNNSCGKTTVEIHPESCSDGISQYDTSNSMKNTNFSPQIKNDSLVQSTSLTNVDINNIMSSKEMPSCVSSAPKDSSCVSAKPVDTDDRKRNENVVIPTEEEVLQSPSLHFSQLTVPSTADSESSKSLEFSSTIDVLGITLPTISNYSLCSTGMLEDTRNDPALIKSTPGEISVKGADTERILPKEKELPCDKGISLVPSLKAKLGEENFSGSDSFFIEAEKKMMKEKNDEENGFLFENRDCLVPPLDIKNTNVDEERCTGSDSLINESEEMLNKHENEPCHTELLNKKKNKPCIPVSNDMGAFCESSISKTLDSCSDETNLTGNSNPEVSKIVSGWKESSDCNGKNIYINVRTGNTSYDKPIVKDMPEWNSSQSLGAPLLKVPLTHEPDYVPYGKYHPRQDFTLSHGYSTFLSWKKRRDAEKIACKKTTLTSSKLNIEEKSKTENLIKPSNMESLTAANENVNHSQSVETTESLVEGKEMPSHEKLSSSMPLEIDSLLKDFEADNESVKWAAKPSLEETSESNVAQICQLWEPHNFAMDADVLHSEPCVKGGEGMSGKGGPVRIYNIVHPYKFTKEMLPSCKVLGQVDKKFIACNIKYTLHEEPNSSHNLMVLFDQHAIHERVRLESIIKENLEIAESGKRVIVTSMVTPPISLSLPDDEVRLMVAYKELFFQRGLHFTKTSNSEISFHGIPNYVVPKESNMSRYRRGQAVDTIVESIVRDLCHILYTTGGVVGIIPKPLQYLMNSQACRGAVKFGDELTLSECQELIDSLCSCQLPFQCAHGRPSIVPVVNMTHLAKLEKREGKPNIKKLVSQMSSQENEEETCSHEG
ncbi:uncharacterized protein [Palaemon carinicauda]|uniref:uncharacterized protein n=1 Tax=Palaemon carinicauda TaxID=392227 RepID=UPI0035B64575